MATRTRKASLAARISRWFKSPAGQALTHRGPGVGVFAVGAYISYWHIVSVVRRGHERADSALLYPVIIDLALVVAARYLSRAKTRIGKLFAALGFLAGASYTLYCNFAASTPTWDGRLLGVAPGVMVILTAGALHWGEMKAAARKRPVKGSQTVVKAQTATASVPRHNGHNGRPVGVLAPAGWASTDSLS